MNKDMAAIIANETAPPLIPILMSSRMGTPLNIRTAWPLRRSYTQRIKFR